MRKVEIETVLFECVLFSKNTKTGH